MASAEDRPRALQHMCLAIPRTAQALHEEVRQLGCAQADKRAAPHMRWLHMCSAHGTGAPCAGADMSRSMHASELRLADAECMSHVACSLLVMILLSRC